MARRGNGGGGGGVIGVEVWVLGPRGGRAAREGTGTEAASSAWRTRLATPARLSSAAPAAVSSAPGGGQSVEVDSFCSNSEMGGFEHSIGK